ncbi:aminoglycoside phosphotransferase family protein [Micromonospora sp. WMMD1082]|uniref:phosphotransferase family protein n=1 Tax=Micromonospora sp. WMMD1082 TaxID=3016104 RepID=UPI002417E6E3|nr:aminoglycoside phosphotransferase family protein [Micromonospora sp. WMMD1082]MDG4795496.1 aminoglycoside phosphotransferase family protein [Micromonospora sp. WMMD1082]
MEFRPLPRPAGAFQRSVTAGDVQAIVRRVFGVGVDVVSATELGGGMYNSTYRVELAGRRPVILRVAPEPGRQFRSERALMRNEYASVPWLAPIAPLLPHVLVADWSHEVIGRDYLVQTLLDGVPGPEGLGVYPRSAWPVLYRQLGSIARDVHAVRGPHFGPVIGPGYDSWSASVIASLTDIAADVDSVGLDAADLRKAADAAGAHRGVLDEITEPRMLTGDLWTVNVMLAADAPEPTITGVLDMDRTWWGDPAADWTIRMAGRKDDERVAFWDTYGTRDTSTAAALRALIYEARHIGAIRLERDRLGNTTGVRDTYDDLAVTLAALT